MTSDDGDLTYLEKLAKVKSDRKLAILDYARNNTKSPIGVKTRKYMRAYANSKSKEYDESFSKEIRSLRPNWVFSIKEETLWRKEQLLKIAKSGKKKPGYKHPLGSFIRNYTYLGNSTYDEEFDSKLRSMRPDWFISDTEKMINRKEEYIRRASRGESKPKSESIFFSYIRDNEGNPTYDAKFKAKIKEVRPDWLEKKLSEKTKLFRKNFLKKVKKKSKDNKTSLLEFAKKTDKKPIHRTAEYNRLYRLVSPRSPSYDPKFTETLLKIRPDWVFKRRSTAAEHEKELMKKAILGEKKPSIKNSLGRFLFRKTDINSKSYDPVLTEVLEILSSHWFE